MESRDTCLVSRRLETHIFMSLACLSLDGCMSCLGSSLEPPCLILSVSWLSLGLSQTTAPQIWRFTRLCVRYKLLYCIVLAHCVLYYKSNFVRWTCRTQTRSRRQRSEATTMNSMKKWQLHSVTWRIRYKLLMWHRRLLLLLIIATLSFCCYIPYVAL